MDSTTKRWLFFAASLSCTVAIIAQGYRVFDRSKDFSDGMASRQESVYTRMEEYPITRYDGYYIKGSTACGYIKTAVGEYGLLASVTTDKGTFEVVDDALFSCFRDPASDYYVNPIEEYMCDVIRDANGVIQEVKVSVKTQ